MTLPADVREPVLSYIRHQAAKSLPELAALMERTGDECARCLEDTSDAQASFSHGEEWSMKEVVGHMLGSSAAINHEIAGLAAGRESRPPGRTGITDGRFTHVVSGGLEEGDAVVVGLATSKVEGPANPMGGGGGGGRGGGGRRGG